MSKLSNRWEQPMSGLIPYLQWEEMEHACLNSWDITRHNHAFYELHIITEGECSVQIDNTELHLQAGQGIIVAPDVFHGPEWISDPFFRFSVPFYLDAVMIDALQLRRFCLFEVSGHITDLCDAIISEFRQKDSFLHRQMISAQFSHLMICVFRSLQNNPQSGHDLDLKQIEDMTVIDNFFATTTLEQCTRKALSLKLHCSERQLLRKLYKLYGVSFREKLAQSRIDMAQHLLRSTTMSIQEISIAVGYSDNAAFYRVFRIHTGITPMEYRKTIRGDKTT